MNVKTNAYLSSLSVPLHWPESRWVFLRQRSWLVAVVDRNWSVHCCRLGLVDWNLCCCDINFDIKIENSSYDLQNIKLNSHSSFQNIESPIDIPKLILYSDFQVINPPFNNRESIVDASLRLPESFVHADFQVRESIVDTSFQVVEPIIQTRFQALDTGCQNRNINRQIDDGCGHTIDILSVVQCGKIAKFLGLNCDVSVMLSQSRWIKQLLNWYYLIRL